MLDIKHIKSESPKHFSVPNLILLAGAGQNVGKTTFAASLIKHLKSLNHTVFGLKITPHFHEKNPENLIIQNDDFQISLEKKQNGNKDSSKMLSAGAEEVFFIQSNSDSALPDAFDFVHRMGKENILWVCESGGLREFVDPGLFLYFKLKGTISEKPSAKKWMPLADRIVEFSDNKFSLSPKQIIVTDNTFILR